MSGKPHVTIWNPRTFEDRMLQIFWQDRLDQSGRLYVEVPLAGPKGHELWVTGSTRRRIDAVWVPETTAAPGIVPYSAFAHEFARDIAANSITLIEVKPKLNRTAIGQIFVAGVLFEQQYGKRAEELTVVCEDGDSALEWACAQKEISVVKLDPVQRPPATSKPQVVDSR